MTATGSSLAERGQAHIAATCVVLALFSLALFFLVQVCWVVYQSASLDHAIYQASWQLDQPLPVYRRNEQGAEVGEDGRPFSRMNKKPRVRKHYAGLKYHELRHTQATLLLANGTPIKTVQGRLGHAKASTTLDIYGHAMPEQDRDAATLFASLLSD